MCTVNTLIRIHLSDVTENIVNQYVYSNYILTLRQSGLDEVYNLGVTISCSHDERSFTLEVIRTARYYK